MSKHKRVRSYSQDEVNYRITRDLCKHNWLIKKLQRHPPDLGRESKEMANAGNKKRQKSKNNSLPVSIPLKFLKRSTQEKLINMDADRGSSNFNFTINKNSNNLNNNLRANNKRKYEDDICDKLIKMRSIEMLNAEQKGLNTPYSNKPDLISDFSKSIQGYRSGLIKAPEKGNSKAFCELTKNNLSQNNSPREQNNLKRHKLPEIIQPETGRYAKKSNNDNNNKRLETIHLTSRYNSALTICQDSGTNTHIYDVKKYEILEFIEKHNITLDTIKGLIQNKTFIDKSTNTDMMFGKSNEEFKENCILLDSDSTDTNSAYIEMNDINNNGTPSITQNNSIVVIDSDDDIAKTLDKNVIDTVLAHSARNKFLINQLCTTFVKATKDLNWGHLLGSVNSVENNEANTLSTADKSNSDAKTQGIQIGTVNNEKNISHKIDSTCTNTSEYTQDIRQNQNKASEALQVIPMENETLAVIEQNKTLACGSNVKTLSETLVPDSNKNGNNDKEHLSDRLEQELDVNNRVTLLDKDRLIRVFIRILDLLSVDGENTRALDQIDTITLANKDILNHTTTNTTESNTSLQTAQIKSAVQPVLVNRSQQETNIPLQVAQTNVAVQPARVATDHSQQRPSPKVYINRATANTPESNTSLQIAQTRSAALTAVANRYQQLAAEKIVTNNSTKNVTSNNFKRSDSAPQNSQNDSQNSENRDLTYNIIQANNNRSRSRNKTPIQGQPGHSLSMQSTPALCTQNDKPQIDQRYFEKTQQYQEMISQERLYGPQTIAQTVTSEAITNSVQRNLKDPRLMTQTPNAQPMNYHEAMNAEFRMMSANQVHHPSYQDVRMQIPWQPVPNSYNTTWPNNQTGQIRHQAPIAQIGYRNPYIPNRYQQLEQQQAAWTSNAGNYPNANWGFSVNKHNHHSA